MTVSTFINHVRVFAYILVNMLITCRHNYEQQAQHDLLFVGAAMYSKRRHYQYIQRVRVSRFVELAFAFTGVVCVCADDV